MADEADTTRDGSADSEPDVHRLRDIVVEEVSLVDRAANKRRFLVVKRSGDMADDGKPQGRHDAGEDPAGTAARQGKKPKPRPGAEANKARPRAMRAASEDEEDETEKARRPPSARGEDEDDEDEVDTGKAASEDDEDEDEEDATKADRTRSGADAGTGARGGAGGTRPRRSSKPAEKADEDDVILSPAAKSAVLRALAQALERLMGVANQVKDAKETDDEAEASVPDDLAGELEEVGELLEEAGEQLAYPASKADRKKPGAAGAGTAKADVAKAGARMAKDRLDRFQKALALLSEVLKELTESRAPAGPSAGSAENPLAKRDAAPGMHELVASVRELTRVVKRQEEELVRMQKTRATSNAIPVDGGRRAEPQAVSWPLDMNRPISRDKVRKEMSFFDE